MLAYLCAALSPTIDVCLLLLAGYIITLLFLTGLILNWADIPGERKMRVNLCVLCIT